MDDEVSLALNILRNRVSKNKLAAIIAIVVAEQQGSNLTRCLVKLGDAKVWLTREIDNVQQKLDEGT